MRKVSSISKSISSNKVSPVTNNYVTDNRMTYKFRFLFGFQAILGLNRLHLLNVGKFVNIIINIYSIILIISSTFFVFRPGGHTNALYNVLKYTNFIELILLAFSSKFLQSKSLPSLFQRLYEVDKSLNILNDDYIPNIITRGTFWIFVTVIYSLVEYILYTVYIEHSFNAINLILYFAVFAHDSEQIFYCSLIRTVYLRLKVVKEHVRKKLKLEEEIEVVEKGNVDAAEALVNQANLDSGALHGVYETLHNCAEQLNSLMNFPMLLILICSGLSTTLLSMSLIKIIQTNSLHPLMLLYCGFRSVKYTAHVIVPCYYCNITMEQVQVIQTILHDAINLGELDVNERRRVKAFLQLVRDNNFTYGLCGIIKLNMSLPLSYISICTTYLVIILQFSKFID